MYLPEEPHQSFIGIATAGPAAHGSNILTAGGGNGDLLCRSRNKPNERAISEMILSAPVHKMTVIYLRGLMGPLIDANESMITLPGAFKTPHPKPPRLRPHATGIFSGECCRTVGPGIARHFGYED